MKRVVSVSLGSSRRDHSVQIELLGMPFEIKRIGTDGDFQRAINLLQELDGKVDAIGLGGIDVYLWVRGQRYVIQDGRRLMEAVRHTPVVDGSGLKNTLEREAVIHLNRIGLLPRGTKVLMVSALDRFGMAEALSELGCDTVFGDLIFTAGIPYPVRDIAELEELARKLLPEIGKMPFHMLYPTGEKQHKQAAGSEKFAQYYEEAEVIAGDFHLIRKYLPQRIDNKMVLTNTTTREDVELFRERGASYLVTTTPDLQGRSFGTNVLEAAFVALLGKSPNDISQEEYLDLIARLELKPRIEHLN